MTQKPDSKREKQILSFLRKMKKEGRLASPSKINKAINGHYYKTTALLEELENRGAIKRQPTSNKKRFLWLLAD